MTVDEVYKISLFQCRKNQLGSLPPLDFANAFNAAQRNYYDTLIGRVEQYRYDKSVPRIGLDMTDVLVGKLMPFHKDAIISVLTGVATKPLDYNKLSAMYTVSDDSIERTNENKLADRLKSSIDPITSTSPIFVEKSATWSIYPNTITSIKVSYYSLPIEIKWGYTIDGNGRPVYSPSASIDPIWRDNDIDEIIARSMKLLGVSLKENVLTSFGESVIQKGE